MVGWHAHGDRGDAVGVAQPAWTRLGAHDPGCSHELAHLAVRTLPCDGPQGAFSSTAACLGRSDAVCEVEGSDEVLGHRDGSPVLCAPLQGPDPQLRGLEVDVAGADRERFAHAAAGQRKCARECLHRRFPDADEVAGHGLSERTAVVAGAEQLRPLVRASGPDLPPRAEALGSRLSALGSRLSALGSRLSALGSRLSALGSRLSLLMGRPVMARPVSARPGPRLRTAREPPSPSAAAPSARATAFSPSTRVICSLQPAVAVSCSCPVGSAGPERSPGQPVSGPQLTPRTRWRDPAGTC